MCAPRLCAHRMAEMLLIDGITNVEYHFRCKMVKWGYRTNLSAYGHGWEWNMGDMGGLNSSTVVRIQVVSLYPSNKFNNCFMDWAGLKTQTRCHFQLALRQWGSILCLNQETCCFLRLLSCQYQSTLNQSPLQLLMDLRFRFILSG